MAVNAVGAWIGFGVGETDPPAPRNAPNWHAISLINAKLHGKYQWAKDLGVVPGDTFTEATGKAIAELGLRTGVPVPLDNQGRPVANLALRKRLGSYPPPPQILPIGLSIEGHCSDMSIGPAADTADELEALGLCRSQWVGYDNCRIPFKTQTAVDEAARLLWLDRLPNGAPFPKGTPWMLFTFSEGGIAGYELHAQHLAPGGDLEWREADRVGTLAYGDPCGPSGHVAPWARSWVTDTSAHGLDPVNRYGLPGCPSVPDNYLTVRRKGDIFAENWDDQASQMRSAVYMLVARGSVFGGQSTLATEIAETFQQPLSSVLAVFKAIMSGVVFLGTRPNPHYSPYDISGGVRWAAGILGPIVAAG